MHNRWQIFIGMLIIAAGLVFLVGNVFDIDTDALCFPIGLIALGVFLLLRPHFVSPGVGSQLKLLGDVRRYGDWQVADEEIWLGVGDVRLDMTNADIPVGETQIRIFGFVGDVRVRVPEDVGVSVSSTSFITDARVLDKKYNRVLTPFHLTSENYEIAERKVRLEISCFVGEIRVRRVSAEKS